jgi:hypothetical protein
MTMTRFSAIRVLVFGVSALAPALALTVLSGAAQAKVSAAEAAKLGKELTPLGAIRAGNADGAIPAYEGGITKPPAGYTTGMHHPDPFPEDKPLFTIDASNVDKYADKLSPGQIAMFKRYPQTWRMPVYVSRRTASAPQRVYDAAIANATTAELVGEGEGVKNARESVPFPIPQNGAEGIWNHLLRFRGDTVQQVFGQAAPTAGGSYTMVMLEQKIVFPYNKAGGTTENTDNILAYFLQSVTSPPRLAGELLLVHETINQEDELRRAWTYNPGQRRVRRAPNIAYDNPGTASDSQRTNDVNGMFNGALDRYDWELLGRKEMYVPYNSYKLHSDKLQYDDILKAGHINPDHLRYELHRVWVVDAKLKPGTSHIYARRTFYLDEDSWQILAMNQYDGRGQIWRVSESHSINYYEVPVSFTTLEVHYDLQNGRYLAFGLNNQDPVEKINVPLDLAEFTPDAMRAQGRR